MVATADPTMQFLDSLNDRSRFEIIPGTPIMMSHRRRFIDKDGNDKTIEITPDDLPELIEVADLYKRKFGVVPVITEGHRRPSLSESEQPDIIGYALNLRMGTFGPRREPCILADQYIRR